MAEFWIYFGLAIFTDRKRSLQRLCFHRCPSVHGGGDVCPIACWDTHTPLGGHPWGRLPLADTPRKTPPMPSACWDTVNKRAVRILLECSLLVNWYWFHVAWICYIILSNWLGADDVRFFLNFFLACKKENLIKAFDKHKFNVVHRFI